LARGDVGRGDFAVSRIVKNRIEGGRGIARAPEEIGNDDDGVDHDDNDHFHARGKNGRERDFWADSSDEDEEYSRARRMLTRVSKKKRW